MQYILGLFALILGANASTQEFFSDMLDKVHEAAIQCAEKEGATPDDMKELVEHKHTPTAHAGRCVIACVYEEFKMLKPDLTWDKPAFIDAIAVLKTEDPDMYEKLVKLLDICYSEALVSEDRCEVASAMFTCGITKGPSMGLTQESMMG